MKGKALDRFFLICLVGLLILRFPVLILPRYGLLPIAKDAATAVFQIGTYLLTAVMVVLKRDSLAEYHIDRLALSLLILAPIGCLVTQRLLWDWNAFPASTYVNAGLSVLFLIALLIWRPTMPHKGTGFALKWVAAAIFVGACLSFVVSYFIHFQIDVPPGILMSARVPRAILLIFTQLSTAAALEEPLFRGFLWGILKARGWKEIWIWLFQTLLFMLGHIYYLGSFNYSFFLVVPLCALVLGLAAWRSRSIGTSMIAHGIINSLGGNLFVFLWF